jgi:hypothetical protein
VGTGRHRVASLLAATGAGAAALIDGGDVKNSSLTCKDVRNKSLTKADFRGSVRGPRGSPGPQGSQGPPGPTVLGRIAYVERSFTVAAGDIDIQGVDCPSGYRIVSGGFTIISPGAVPFVDKSYSQAEWSVGVDNFNSSLSADATAHAWCAPAGQAVAAQSHGSPRRDEARQRASHR